MTLHMYVTGLAKLEYKPEADFMRQFVAACMASRFEDFNPQELSNVRSTVSSCVRLRPVSSTGGRSDVTPVRGRPGKAGVPA
jgi:AMMECR1 domain-containing protein